MRLQRYTETVQAGLTLRMDVVGTFLQIVSASGSLDLITDDVQIKGAQAGDGFKGKPFRFLSFKDNSGAANTVSWVVGDAEFLSATAGVVTIATNAPIRPNWVHTAGSVGVASGQILTANPARLGLYLENQSASQTISLRWGVNAATALTGITLGPGQWKEWDASVSTQAMQAISTGAATPLLIVEG